MAPSSKKKKGFFAKWLARGKGSAALTAFQILLFCAYIGGGVAMLVLSAREASGDNKTGAPFIRWGDTTHEIRLSPGYLLGTGMLVLGAFVGVDVAMYFLAGERRKSPSRRARSRVAIVLSWPLLFCALGITTFTQDGGPLVELSLLSMLMTLLPVVARYFSSFFKDTDYYNPVDGEDDEDQEGGDENATARKKSTVANMKTQPEMDAEHASAFSNMIGFLLIVSALLFAIVSTILFTYYDTTSNIPTRLKSPLIVAVCVFGVFWLLESAMADQGITHNQHLIVKMWVFWLDALSPFAEKLFNGGFVEEVVVAGLNIGAYVADSWILYVDYINEVSTP